MNEQTYRIQRISHDPLMDRIFFNGIGRSLELEPGTAEHPGPAQDVPDSVVQAILSDEGLAPHFLCTPNAPSDGPAAPPMADPEVSSGKRRKSEPVG